MRDGAPTDDLIVGIAHEKEETERINHVSIMAVILVLHVDITNAFVIQFFLGM